MSNHAEDVLYANLSDVDALEVLAREGLDERCIPTEEMRPVVAWCVDYFFKSGRLLAPSQDAIMDMWKDVIEDAEVSLGDGTETDSIEYAIDSLKSTYIHLRYNTFQREAAADMAKADPASRVETLAKTADTLFSLSLDMQSTASRTTGAQGIVESLSRYEIRAATGHVTQGLTFGIGFEPVDQHMYGVHPGELCVVAAGPKTGKSYLLDLCALREWDRDREAVLFTLENSVEMTMDRIACLAVQVNARRYQRGLCTESEVFRVKEFINERIPQMKGKLHVLKPEPGRRTMPALVRQAQMLGAESLLIDQLTFVEPADERASRPEQMRQMSHDLKTMISTGRQHMSCLLAHQINREGVKAAEKAGRLEMYHMAEGSEVERTADWVLGLYQSSEQRHQNQAQLQILAARREETKAWLIYWDIADGQITTLSELDLAS
jgi:replicative DNA helicase